MDLFYWWNFKKTLNVDKKLNFCIKREDASFRVPFQSFWESWGWRFTKVPDFLTNASDNLKTPRRVGLGGDGWERGRGDCGLLTAGWDSDGIWWTIRAAICLHIQQRIHKRILHAFPRPIRLCSCIHEGTNVRKEEGNSQQAEIQARTSTFSRHSCNYRLYAKRGSLLAQ